MNDGYPDGFPAGTRIRWTPPAPRGVYCWMEPRSGVVLESNTYDYGRVVLTVETAAGRYLVDLDKTDVEVV